MLGWRDLGEYGGVRWLSKIMLDDDFHDAIAMPSPIVCYGIDIHGNVLHGDEGTASGSTPGRLRGRVAKQCVEVLWQLFIELGCTPG